MNISHKWNMVNNAGEGFPIGEEDDTPTQAATREGYAILETEDGGTTDEVVMAVHLETKQLILVANSNGPWATVFKKTEE